MSISVVIPAYKEAENLDVLLPRLVDALSKLNIENEVLVIDAQERTDNTKEVCDRYACTHLPREKGDFYGDAIRTGFAAASMKYTVVMDADGSHNPEDIARLYQAILGSKYDLIIGSRYIQGGNSSNNFILKIMSYVVNLVYRIIFNIKAKDVSDSFRMYQTNQIKKLVLECDNFDVVEEILIRLSIAIPSFTLHEVPIFFNKRMYGESKRDLVKFVFSYISTICKMLKIKRHALQIKKQTAGTK